MEGGESGVKEGGKRVEIRKWNEGWSLFRGGGKEERGKAMRDLERERDKGRGNEASEE